MAIATVAALCSALAVADGQRPRGLRRFGEPLASCADEGEICKGVALGQGGKLKCLIENIERTSPLCRKALGRTLGRIELVERMPNCRRPIRLLCRDPLPAALVPACLVQHRSQLSERCRLQLKAERERLIRTNENPAFAI